MLVPLSTLLAPPELVAQLRVASVQYLVAVEEFRGHRYLDELKSESQSPTDLPALHGVWTLDKLPRPSEATTATVDAVAATVTAADTLVIMFTSGSSGPPKGVIHSHGNALGAVRSGLEARCIDADTRLYLPMPFFWVGGFGSGILSALLAGATLVTEEIPQSGDHAPPARARAGDAVPRLARPSRKPLPASRSRSTPTSPRCGRAAWRRCCRSISGLRRARGPSCSA